MTHHFLRFLFAPCLAMVCAAWAISPACAATIVDNGAANSIAIPSIDIEIHNSVVPAPTTVNIVTGGQVGFVLNPDGTIQMVDDGMGGMVPAISNTDHSVAVFDTSILNMSDGETADSIATFDSATANISGGVVGDNILASDSSKVMVTGGDFANDLEVEGMAQVTVSGGTFAGNLSISDSGAVTLSVESFEEAGIEGSGMLFMLPDGEIADVAEFQDSSALEMSGGTFADDVILLNSSSALITGGVIEGALIVADDAQVNIQMAEVGELVVEGNTLTTITDGAFGEVFATGLADEGGMDGTSQINIQGGTFEGPVTALSGSATFRAGISISGGAFEEGIAPRGIGARIDVSGATLEASDSNELEASNLGELNVDGATGTVVDVNASIGGEININQISTEALNITSFGGFVNVNGGDADLLNITVDRGFVMLSGGQFGDIDIEALSNSVVTIFGRSFLVNGMPFAGGNVGPPSGDISGVFADGSPFSTAFIRQFEPQNRQAIIRLVAIPEPGAVALTMLFPLALMIRRRHKSTF
jgi:hypothetical protein